MGDAAAAAAAAAAGGSSPQAGGAASAAPAACVAAAPHTALDAVLVLRRCSCVLLVLESAHDDLGLDTGALNPLDVLVILRPHPPRHGIGESRTWAW